MENEKKIVHPKIHHTEFVVHSTYIDENGNINGREDIVELPTGFYEERDIESKIIELVIYYSISKGEDFLGLKGCSRKLKDEIDLAEKGNTIFHINEEHIVDKLAQKFKEMDKTKYIDILKKAIRRIEYFCTYNNENYLLEIDSEQCIEELADEIVSYSKSLEELEIENCIYLPSTMYEIGCKYLDCNDDVNGYKYIHMAAEKGHIKAAYQKIRCLYFGSKEYKNQYQAFYEANELLKDKKYSSIHMKLYELIGEMYYEGKGIKQDYSKALEYFKKTEKDLAVSKYYLGLMYINGYSVEKDKRLGINYILKSAKDGYKMAINYIIDYILKKDVSSDAFSLESIDDMFDTDQIVDSK